VNIIVLSVCGWFVSLLVRKKVLLTGLCERKIWKFTIVYDKPQSNEQADHLALPPANILCILGAM